MDLLTILIEAVFGVVFVWAVWAWWRRRDALGLDIVLVFTAMASLIVAGVIRAAFGSTPPVVSAIAAVLLLGQPVFTLRLASRITRVPRWVLRGATAGWLLTAIPLAILGSATAPVVTLTAVAVFVVAEGAAAFLFGRAARRRAGAGAARLWAAALATALFAFAILAAGGGAAGGTTREVATQVGRIVALLSAVGYLVAFVPPGFLRRTWQATTAYRGLRELLAVDGQGPADLWQRFLDIARNATGAAGAMVVESSPDRAGRVAMVVGLEPGLIGRRIPGLAPTAGEVVLDGPGSVTVPDEILEIGRSVQAPFAQVVRLGPGASAPSLVLLGTHRSLFADDDRHLLEALGQQTASLVEHRETLTTQQRLTEELGDTVHALRMASQAKSDFLASMSHELRTPLNAIIGFSDLMSFEAADDSANVLVPREWIDHIRRGGGHLVELVNDVLDLSKVEAGRLDLDRESLELLPTISESVAGLRPLADRKNLTISLAIPTGERVHADRGRLRQIMYNLLSNAIKFTPDGGRIIIEARPNGQNIELSVVDTGVGIAPEHLGAVFEEFRQVGEGTQRSEGTGLGLALTRRLVEAHGGRIELESTPGVGSRFTAILPRAEPTEQPSGDLIPALADPTVTTGAAGPAHRAVLVVEDDASAVRLLRAILEPEGYRVQVAASGELALELAREERPSAILLDVLLPGIDGWEVLRRLKADPDLRDVPVVIVTVIDEKEVGLALGARDYLVKPVERDALVATLDRLTLTTKVKTRTVQILTIDDDAATLDALSGMLGTAGFGVIPATSGRIGVERARDQRPDLVICDLVMPDLDGFGVVGELSADPATAEIPIIILTGHDVTASDKRRLNGKVLGIVTKGVGAHDGLLAWLERARVTP